MNNKIEFLEIKVKELTEEKDKWLSMYYEASTSLDIQAEKLMESQDELKMLKLGICMALNTLEGRVTSGKDAKTQLEQLLNKQRTINTIEISLIKY